MTERVQVDLELDTSRYTRRALGAAKATRTINTAAKELATRTFPGLSRQTKALGSDFGRVLGARAAFRGAKDFITGIVSEASQLNESMNAVNKIFGEATDTIFEFGETSAFAVGLSRAEFQQLSTVTGALLQTFITDIDDVATETIKLTERAADLASVFDTDVNDALVAIQASIRGQQRPIRNYGVQMDEAAVKARALELGLAATTSELTLQDRALARLDILYEQTDKSVGDFQDTIGDLANASRVAAAAWKDAQAQFGAAITPAATTAVVKFSTALEGVNRTSLLLRQRGFDIATAFKPFVDVLDVFVGPQANFTDAMSDFDQALSNGIDRAVEYIDAVNAGADETDAFADAVFELAKKGDASEAALAALTSAVGLTGQETTVAIEAILKSGGAFELSAEKAALLRAELDNLISLGFTPEAVTMRLETLLLKDAIEDTGAAAGPEAAGGSLAGFVSTLAEGATEAEIMAEKLGFLRDQLDLYNDQLLIATELAKRGITPARIGEVLAGQRPGVGGGAGIRQRQHGGLVAANEPVLVGERGIEVFVPDRAGRVIPNNQLGGNTVNVTVNQPETVDFASDLAAGLIMGQITQQVEAF